MAKNGYREFDLAQDPRRMTSGFAEAMSSYQNSGESYPNLFIYPYDWRQGNASHMEELRQYIDNISNLHGGAKVNVLTHSMGGLILRRYLLEQGSEKIGNVVTVACPWWGAPSAVYRALTGIFYDKPLIDRLNLEDMRRSLMSLPSTFELMPTGLYLVQNEQAHGQKYIFRDSWFDYDGNGIPWEGYANSQFWKMMDTQAALAQLEVASGKPLLAPSSVNSSFHTLAQDSAFNDGNRTPAILAPTLHIYGDQTEKKTPVAVKAKPRLAIIQDFNEVVSPFFTKPTRFFSPVQFEKILDRGDETVPTLSTNRTAQFRWPSAETRRIEGKGESVNHNGLMNNKENVWPLIYDFLADGKLENPAAPADNGAGVLSNAEPDRFNCFIAGSSEVQIVDQHGNANLPIGPEMRKAIPGVEITYGGEEPWVLLSYTSDSRLTISAEGDQHSLEIDVERLSEEVDAVEVKRFRVASVVNGWRLSLQDVPTTGLSLDANGNGVFEPGEAVPPSHHLQGPVIDTQPPEIICRLEPQNDTPTIRLSAEDDLSQPLKIFYALDGKQLEEYQAPIAFTGEISSLQAYAEDAAGNRSGLMEVRLNPALDIQQPSSGIVELSWDIADNYDLEEWTPGATGWRSIESRGVRQDGKNRLPLPEIGQGTKLFRLRSKEMRR